MKQRRMKIVTPVDIYGTTFKPELEVYEVIYTHELYVALGICGIVLRKVPWNCVVDE